MGAAAIIQQAIERERAIAHGAPTARKVTFPILPGEVLNELAAAMAAQEVIDLPLRDYQKHQMRGKVIEIVNMQGQFAIHRVTVELVAH